MAYGVASIFTCMMCMIFRRMMIVTTKMKTRVTNMVVVHGILDAEGSIATKH